MMRMKKILTSRLLLFCYRPTLSALINYEITNNLGRGFTIFFLLDERSGLIKTETMIDQGG
jgi:hypothetical protein